MLSRPDLSPSRAPNKDIVQIDDYSCYVIYFSSYVIRCVLVLRRGSKYDITVNVLTYATQ